MAWHVEYTKAAVKQLKKMDRFDAGLIVSWIGKNLEGCDDPRLRGKGLTADRTGEWRYRVGDYRILCIIEDEKLVIEIFFDRSPWRGARVEALTNCGKGVA